MSEVKQKTGTNFFHVKLGQEIMSGIDKLQFAHAQVFHILDLGLKK